MALKLKHPINIAAREFGANDYHYYAWMRENAPVYKGKFGFLTAYIVTRYDDCMSVLTDSRFVRNRKNAVGGSGRLPFPLPKAIQAVAYSMILEDEPEHRRLRNLVHKAFTPRTVAQLTPRIEALTHQLLNEAERQGEVDLMEAYALPIPLTIIAEMVGVPEEDRPIFLKLSKSIAAGFSARALFRWYFDVRGIIKYIRELIARRRARPQDDLLTALVQAEDEGEKLTEDELVSMVILLLIAGYETTVNLIANGTRVLLEHPDQLALLREQPDLIDSAVEEILRYDSPVQSTKPGYPAEDIVMRGVTIPRGKFVLPIVGSANRDEAVFENPEQFDITRSPNKHIGFGYGIHYCLGAPLARLEGKIGISHLIERFPDLRLGVEADQLGYQPRPMWHRLESLPVKLA